MYDIFYIDYKEPNAEFHWNNLKSRFVHSKRISNVLGIHNSHQLAAKMSTTKHYWVVDGDNIVSNDFNFSYRPEQWSIDYSHVWYSKNSVTGDSYGYGGIKLFNKELQLKFSNNTYVDYFSTSSNGLINIITDVASTTIIDSSPKKLFITTLRECWKLKNVNNRESLKRLDTWLNCTPNTQYIESYNLAINHFLKIKDSTIIKNFDKLSQLYDKLNDTRRKHSIK